MDGDLFEKAPHVDTGIFFIQIKKMCFENIWIHCGQGLRPISFD